MINRVSKLMVVVTFAALFTQNAFGETLNLVEKASFDKDLSVPAAVKAECNLEDKIPGYVQENAKDQFDTITMVPKASMQGKNLSMTITGVMGTGGGAWSGAKSITIKGTLTDNGKPVGTFTATRFSGGGAFGGYKGTCAILGRCASALGKDVAKWLKEPTMDARLGDHK